MPWELKRTDGATSVTPKLEPTRHCPLAWYSSSPVARSSYFRRINMRRLLVVVGVVCVCASLALAQSKTSNAWTCPKPSDAHSIEVGDKPGHAYSVDQITCTSTKGEIAGVKEKEGTGTEFAEVTGNSMKGHGVFVETMANGDKLHFVYQFTATTKDGQMQSNWEGGWVCGLGLHRDVFRSVIRSSAGGSRTRILIGAVFVTI